MPHTNKKELAEQQTQLETKLQSSQDRAKKS